MTYLKSWEEFEKAAERLYLQDPKKVGFRDVNVEAGLMSYYFTALDRTAECFIWM